VICAFAATAILATNIFLPSLPAIAADLRVSSAAVTSTITVFLAIFAVGQLIVGPLSDRLGRQMPILIGLCIFVLGTIWCAFAGDLRGLLIGRSIQVRRMHGGGAVTCHRPGSVRRPGTHEGDGVDHDRHRGCPWILTAPGQRA
jgi:MFS family permease